MKPIGVWGLAWGLAAGLVLSSACSSNDAVGPSDGGVEASAPDAAAGDAASPDAGDAATCKVTETRCGTECVDTRTNGEHCGACGRACSRDAYCAGGACAQRRLSVRWDRTFARVGEKFGEVLIIGAVGTDSSDRIIIAGNCETDLSPVGCTASSNGFDFGGGTKQGDVFVAAFDGAGAYRWDKAYLGKGRPLLAVDAAGNVYFAYMVSGTVDYGGGPRTVATSGIAVVSYDAGGSFRWDYVVEPTSGVAQPMGIAVGKTDEVVLVGTKSGSIDFGGGVDAGVDGFIVALGVNGVHRWTRTLHPPADKGEGFVRSVSVDLSGRIFVSAVAGGPVDLGPGPKVPPTGYFLAAFESDGAFVWDTPTTTPQAIVAIGSNESVAGGTIEDVTRRNALGAVVFKVLSEQDTGCEGPTCPMFPFSVSAVHDELWYLGALPSSPKGAIEMRRKTDGKGAVTWRAFEDKVLGGQTWDHGPANLRVMGSGDIVGVGRLQPTGVAGGRATLSRFARPTN